MQELIELRREYDTQPSSVVACYQVVKDFHKLLLDELPYGQIDPKNLVQGQVEIDGPAQEPRNGKKPLQWHFGGVAYEVCKAIRIQYSYQKYVDGSQVDAAGSLFIGYVWDKPTLISLVQAVLTAAERAESTEERLRTLEEAVAARGLTLPATADGEIAAYQAALASWPSRVTPVAAKLNESNFEGFLADNFPYTRPKESDILSVLKRYSNDGLPGICIEYDGPAREYDSHKAFPYTTESLFNDPSGKYDQLLWWYFGAKAFRITKAMRMEFLDGVNGGSLLVGYQGPGPY